MIRDTVQKYFDAINKGGWESFIADDMVFTVYVLGAPRHVNGKAAYVGATKRFMQIAKSVELKQLVVEGANASAVSSYKLQSPLGNTSTCDVAEILTVNDGKIKSSTIFFDSAGFNAFIAPFAARYYREEI